MVPTRSVNAVATELETPSNHLQTIAKRSSIVTPALTALEVYSSKAEALYACK